MPCDARTTHCQSRAIAGERACPRPPHQYGSAPSAEQRNLDTNAPTTGQRRSRPDSAIRRWDWIAPLLHYVINPARQLTTNNRSFCRRLRLSDGAWDNCVYLGGLRAREAAEASWPAPAGYAAGLVMEGSRRVR